MHKSHPSSRSMAPYPKRVSPCSPASSLLLFSSFIPNSLRFCYHIIRGAVHLTTPHPTSHRPFAFTDMRKAIVSHQRNLQRVHWTFDLPPELLCRIFLLSLSESPFDEIDAEEAIDQDGDIDMVSTTPEFLTTPFALGSVCRYWRSVAWKEPMLWNSVYLAASPAKVEAQASLLRGWLSRSGELPLTLEFDCSDNKWSFEDADKALLLLQPTFQYSARCQTFRTRFPPFCLLLPPEDHNIQDPCFSKLTTLSVVPRFLPDEDDDEPEVDVISLFHHATGLQRLQIRELAFEQLDIHWGHLSKLSANSIYAEDCIRILHSAPRLELCEFENILFPRQRPNISKPIFLPKLQTLHLDMRELNTSHDLILPNITAPKLETLEYVTQFADEFPTSHFAAFMDRSGCRLEELAILQPRMTAQELQVCFSKMTYPMRQLQLILQSNIPGVEAVTLRKEYLARLFPRIKTCEIQCPASIFSQAFDSSPSAHT